MITPLESVLTAKIVFLLIFTNYFGVKTQKNSKKAVISALWPPQEIKIICYVSKQ